MFISIIESRTRRGTGKTPLHLHGFFFAHEPLMATKFKLALERVIAAHLLGRAAAGVSPKAGPAVIVEPAYDKVDDSPYGRGRWASYIAKNTVRWDKRFLRRTIISRTATQTARSGL